MRAILHLSDWNLNDRYYEAPLELIKELKQRIIAAANDMNDAWEWWTNQVAYSGPTTTETPIAYGTVDMTLDEYFLDWNNVEECLNEWTE